MNPYIQLALMPLIGALIGWGTNLFAIKLIFRPLNPIKIPFLGTEIQGLIPKRRLEISKNIGETLEHEIISPEEIMENIVSEETKAIILEHIKVMIASRIGEKLPGFIPSGFRGTIVNYFNDVIDRTGNEIYDEMKSKFIKKAKAKLRIRDLVEEKINSFDLVQLEKLIVKLSKQELKQIEILGGIIGFFVGAIQAGISYYLF